MGNSISGTTVRCVLFEKLSFNINNMEPNVSNIVYLVQYR